MNYSVSLEIFKSCLAFFPPESYTLVKLQLLDQSQEIHLFSRVSQHRLPCITIQAGSVLRWNLWKVECSSPIFPCPTKGEAEGILSCSTDTQCVWVEGKAHSCPRSKRLAHNCCWKRAVCTEMAKSLCAASFLALGKGEGRRERNPAGNIQLIYSLSPWVLFSTGWGEWPNECPGVMMA